MALPALTGSLSNLEAFCATYETGSFTKAAKKLSLTPQAISRSIARLESSLGVTLFRRTTRNLAPTEAARGYYDLSVRAMTLLADGERALLAGRKTPEGRVKISAPTTYGHHRLLPALGDFHARYPGIAVDVNISNQNVDFVREGYDLAIRMGVIEDRTFVCKSLGAFALGVYASPGYLARFGAPASVDDLSLHRCIAFQLPRTGRVLPWAFSPDLESWTPDGFFTCSDDFLAAVSLAKAGVGLVQAYDYLVESEVARGELVEVLREYRGKTRPFSLIFPKSVVITKPMRAMIDFVVATARATSTAP
jgi:DNA-binding transcriptional LysR family regulator